MAGNQPARKSAGVLDDIRGWMAQRQADVQGLLQGAEAAGRQAWGQSTKTGQNLDASSPGAVTALGAHATRGQAQPSPPPDGSINKGDASSDWLDNNVYAKALGGSAARQAGNAAGVVRAGVHTAEGVAQGVVGEASLAGRILNPLDRIFSPPGQSAPEQMIDRAKGVTDYAANAITNAVANPMGLLGDVKNQVHKWNTELNPWATPMADTFSAELGRNFKIGENQGELATDAAALAFGSGVLKVLPRLAPISQAAGTAKFLGQGFSPAQSAYLAEQYEGMGHHFIPRAYEFPKTFAGLPLSKSIAGKPLPRSISDSAFNVLKPKNISRADFYEVHYKVDPKFKGTKVGAPNDKGPWSGKQLGLEDKQYGLLGRIWHGSPAPLNAAAGALGGAGLMEHQNNEDDGSW